MSTQYSEGSKRDIARPRFYMEAVENKAASEAEGRPIFVEKEMVEILIPGDRLLTWVGEVDEKLKERFPDYYAAFKRGGERAASGTPIDEWPPMGKARAAELKALNILSVEELANIPDNVLPKLGMGARAEREKARAFLSAASDGAATAAMAAENAELKRRLDALEAALLDRGTPSAPPPSPDGKPLEDCSDDELKEYIKRMTGEGVRGVPTRETLIRKAIEATPSVAE